jgi:hypothetical protein
MRQTAIVSAIALVITIVTVWGATVVISASPKPHEFRGVVSPSSIDVRQMTIDAGDLPEQSFDAI